MVAVVDAAAGARLDAAGMVAFVGQSVSQSVSQMARLTTSLTVG